MTGGMDIHLGGRGKQRVEGNGGGWMRSWWETEAQGGDWKCVGGGGIG